MGGDQLNKSNERITYTGEDDMSDLERACVDIDYWSKPGDRNRERWV